MLRVNGVNVPEVKLRHLAVDGHLHPDKFEIEISDAAIGSFALTDDFVIEIKNRSDWRTISVAELVKMLTPR